MVTLRAPGAPVGQEGEGAWVMPLRILRAEDGSALIELGVLLPLVIAIFLMATECAVYIQRSMVVVEAASVGARYGTISGNANNTAGMITAAQSASEGIRSFNVTAITFCKCAPDGAQVRCTSSCPNSAPVSHYVQVATTASIAGIFNLAGLPTSIQPSATSTLRAPWNGQ